MYWTIHNNTLLRTSEYACNFASEITKSLPAKIICQTNLPKDPDLDARSMHVCKPCINRKWDRKSDFGSKFATKIVRIEKIHAYLAASCQIRTRGPQIDMRSDTRCWRSHQHTPDIATPRLENRCLVLRISLPDGHLCISGGCSASTQAALSLLPWSPSTK